MSLSNATLLRIDAPPATAAGGDLAAYTAGAALSVPCILDDPGFVIQRLIDQLKLQSTAVLYVMLEDFPSAASVLVPNAQVLVQQGDREQQQPSQLLRIDHADVRVFSGVSHVQCLLRAA